MSFKVCIPVAGTGSRLGDLTKFVNKSLVTVAHRPAICHIIEKFPKNIVFVIALGFKGRLVREFLGLAYPERAFEYVTVSPFEGPGSGLGLSLLKCRAYLQQPFIFISCDTLVVESIPEPCLNWIAYAEAENKDSYRTIGINGKSVRSIYEKGERGEAQAHPYIGLAGIYDYERFWEAMSSGGSGAIDEGEVYGLKNLLGQGVEPIGFTWHDIGNLDSLEKARKFYSITNGPNILEKSNEAIWFVNDDVIKYSDDKEFIKKRVDRAQELKEYIPDVTGSSTNMYRYRKVDGRVFSDIVTLPRFKELLIHSCSFWKLKELNNSEKTNFRSLCKAFYKNKTFDRLNLFYKKFSYSDNIQFINGIEYPSLEEILNKVDWDWLSDGLPGRFHGDFHFENILFSGDANKFIFLDWRQDFCGRVDIGDVYYDLAKLMHGLIINHEIIAKDLYWANWDEGHINFDFHRKQILIDCEIYFKEWLKDNGYDQKKVMVLTALIYLNIAALHHSPYNILLYALGKKILHEEHK